MIDRGMFTPGAVARLAAILACVLVLGGCGPSLVKVLREDPVDPGRYVAEGSSPVAGSVKIVRGGRAMEARLPVTLESGDVLETGPGSIAVIRYRDGNEVVLDSSTRVRLGSIFVDFGRILLRVRGYFSADTEYVDTSVEGTEYWMEAAPRGAAKVVVLDGVVVARAKSGLWGPVRLKRGDALLSGYPGRPGPEVRPAQPDELDAIRVLKARIDPTLPQPHPAGYCCAGGKVSSISREGCERARGSYHRSEKEAAAACAPPPEEGHCCDRGKVYTATRERCERARGSFHRSEKAAVNACEPPPVTGYCCDREKVFETTPEVCNRVRGSFHNSQQEARSACTPPPAKGYCCAGGKVSGMTQDQCRSAKGSFHGSRNAAASVCTPPPVKGYCCADWRVNGTTREACGKIKGRFYLSEKDARNACVPLK